MAYIPCLIYDPSGAFRGYSILNDGTAKLKSTNLWTEEEKDRLYEQLERLNGDVTLKAHWPRADDPEVLALLNDRAFMPYETETRDVVDDENSYYVWHQVPEIDASGAETGRMVNGDIDREASVIAYKKADVPVRPIEVQIRTKRAHEIVARKRAGLAE